MIFMTSDRPKLKRLFAFVKRTDITNSQRAHAYISIRARVHVNLTANRKA
jgi:hypothetical protein